MKNSAVAQWLKWQLISWDVRSSNPGVAEKSQLPKLTNYTPVPWHEPFSLLSHLFKIWAFMSAIDEYDCHKQFRLFFIERNSGYCSILTWRALLDSFENQNRLKFKQEVPACSLKQIDTLQMGKSTPPFQLPRENRSFEGSTTARVSHSENWGKIRWKLKGWHDISKRSATLLEQQR